MKFPVELADDPQVTANGFVRDVEHPTVGPVRVLSPPVRLDGGGFVPAPATAAFASETRAILGELGFDDEDIDGLIDSGRRDGRPWKARKSKQRTFRSLFSQR